MAAHNIRGEEIVGVDLIDEYRMTIDDENIDIIFQFMNCSHFYIEICAQYQHSDVATTIEVLFSTHSFLVYLFFIFNLTSIFYSEHTEFFDGQRW